MNEERVESLRKQLKEMILQLSEEDATELLTSIKEIKAERHKEEVFYG